MLRAPILALVAAMTAQAGPPDGLAERAWSITDAVLARSIDPPTRQQMLLAGLKSLSPADPSKNPALAREVSALTTPAQFAALLARAWPTATDPSKPADAPEASLIEAMLAVVPGEAELISAKDLRVAEQVEGNLYVGVQIALSEGGLISKVLEGGPAEKAGVKEGDRIEAVDGVDIAGKPLKEVVDRLRGPLGSGVAVRLRRPDDPVPFDRKLVRSILPRKTVEGFRKGPNGAWTSRAYNPSPVGMIKFNEIVGSTPAELSALASQLESEGIRASILDFRQVSNANLHAATLLADALLDGGVIGRVRTADSVDTIRAQADALFPGQPLAVLIGGDMPAEARWLTSALEDHRHVATFGDPGGTGREVRTAVPLPGGEWSVRMATGRLERADGRPIPEATRDPKRFRRGILAADLNYAMPVTGPISPTDFARSLAVRTDLADQAHEILIRKLKESAP